VPARWAAVSATEAVGLAVGGLAAVPALAHAHVLHGTPDQPVPDAAVAFSVASVLVLSVVLLRTRPTVPPLGARPVAHVPARLLTAVSASSAALLLAGLACGLAGNQFAARNVLPTLTWGWGVAGVAVLSALVGDVFRWLSPWRALALWLSRSPMVRRWRREGGYPPALGPWPAAAGLLGLAYVELVSSFGADPRPLAISVLLYGGFQLAGMLRYGPDQWHRRGDGLAVMFRLFASVSPICLSDEGTMSRRRPLSGLATLSADRSLRLVLAIIVAIPVYDAVRQTALWRSLSEAVAQALAPAGIGSPLARQVTGTLGLLVAAGAVAAGCRLVVWWLARSTSPARATRAVTAAMVPVGLAFFVAHNVTVLVLSVQTTPRLIADPAGQGWDLLGTADVGVDYAVLSAGAVWLVQLAVLVVGHVAALVAGCRQAAEGALTTFDDMPLVALALTLTAVALWLLAQGGNTG